MPSPQVTRSGVGDVGTRFRRIRNAAEGTKPLGALTAALARCANATEPLGRRVRLRVDLSAYAIGSLLLLVAWGAVGFGAWRVRARVLPEWSGAPARVAEAVLGLATIVVVAELIGAVGLFNRAGLLTTTIVASIALTVAARRARAVTSTVATAAHVEGTSRSSRLEVVAASLGVAVIAAQWAAKVNFALVNGMTHFDTIWYHGPYAARFVQRGFLLGELDRSDPLHAYAGHTSELLHAAVALCFGSDVLSPMLSVGWAALALLAAWCLGRRRGAGPLCVLGTACVLSLPMVEGTHPGQASNDIAAAALLLSTIVLLLEEHLAVASSTIAGLAAGLAVSTKVTSAAPIAVLTVAVLTLGSRRRRRRVGVGWCVALVTTGSYWFIRNAIVAHNPLPFYKFGFGTISLPSAVDRRGDAVSRYLFHGAFWRDQAPGILRYAWGDLWWLVLVLIVGGTVYGVWRARPAMERVVGVALLVGLVSYLFTPWTADGHSYLTRYNVRYAIPSILGSLVFFCFALGAERMSARRIVLVSLLAVTAVNITATHREGIPAWPAGARVAAPIAATVILVMVAAAFAFAHRAPRVREHRRRALGLLAVAVFIVVVLGGWPVQRRYVEYRYRHAGLGFDRVNAALQAVHGADIAFDGSNLTYPFFNSDLSNRVTNPRGPPDGLAPGDRCRAWLEILSHYQYVAVLRHPYIPPRVPVAALDGDHLATRIVADDHGRLYRIHGHLAGNAC